MIIYQLKMLLFSFLFNTFLLSQNVNYRNNPYKFNQIPNNTKRTAAKSRSLAEIERPNNPHYHNDPELKEIIDKLNEEAIKKYQQTHDPYEQLQDVVEKNGTRTMSGDIAEPMSTIEKELLEIYEETFGEKYRIILNPGINCNQNDKSCEFTNKENSSKNSFSSNKVHDNYLDNLRTGCIGGAAVCGLSSIITGYSGVLAGSASAKTIITGYYSATLADQVIKAVAGIKVFFETLISSATSSMGSVTTAGLSGITNASSGAFLPYGMAIVALIAVIIIVILLYVWIRKRRKNSWKHDCKKHLCT